MFCMKIRILFVLLFFQIFLCMADANDYLESIQLSGNDCLGSIATLRSGDMIAAGVDYTSNDILMLKLNPNGAVLKAQRISASSADEAQAVAATSDGGAIVVGSTSSFGAGNTDAFLLKVRASGTIAWKRTFGTSGNEHFVKIVQTPDRGFIALGDADHDPNLNDIVVAKFSPRGRFVWRKVFSAGAFDHASDLRLTSDAGVIVAIAAEVPEGVRSVLVKLNSSGSVEWSRIYGSSGNHSALSAVQAGDGGYYLTEIYTASGSQTSRTILSKLDASGVPLWARSFRSRGSNLSAAVTIVPSGEDLLLSGNITSPSGTTSRGILIGLDENGRTLWRKAVKPDTRPVFIGTPNILSTDGSILVAGCSGSQAANNMDSIVLKTRGNGTIQGGCSKLTSFPLSNTSFQLTSAVFVLEEIPVPFLNGPAGFQTINVSAGESPVCSAE